MTQATIVETNQKLDEIARALNEADSTKKKLTVESQDLTRQIEETESSINNMQKNKISLTTQLEDTKRLADGEARDRAALLTKYISAQISLEVVPTQLRGQGCALANVCAQISNFFAPQIVYSKFIDERMPFLLLGAGALLASIFALFLPETAGVKLPDTIEEAEHLFGTQGCNPCTRHSNVPSDKKSTVNV